MDEVRKNPAWDEFGYQFHMRLKELIENPPAGWDVSRSAMYRDIGHHKTHHTVAECIFGTRMLAKIFPKVILDVGSYRQWVIGLMANPDYNVHVMDVRALQEIKLENEIRIIGDIKNFQLEENYYDAVVTLCTIEHIGLGRYGDEYDFTGDRKAVLNMRRALKPGGALIFTVPMNSRDKPCIWFNAHRVYTYDALMDYLSGMQLVHEELLHNTKCVFRPFRKNDITKDNYDIYCGCWVKR